MHHWTVGGALIEGDLGLLLVRNRRSGGRHDWTPPGGVIDSGEQIVDGLSREVTEETGLTVVQWHGPAYRIEVTAADMGWRLQVEAWRASAWEGDVRVGDDPDGIVVEARFVPRRQCVEHLGRVQPWVTDPVEEWLEQSWNGVRQFSYRIEGVHPDELVVTRT